MSDSGGVHLLNEDDEYVEIVFIDCSLPRHEGEPSDLPANAMVVWLDGDSNGIKQIARFLLTETGVDKIHLYCHVSPGALVIGSGLLNRSTLIDYTAELSAIMVSLKQDASVVIHGGNVAEGKAGAAFVSLLAVALGADIIT